MHNLPLQRRLEPIFESLSPEVVEHFTGVGSPIPEAIGGRRVLDLGCGTGRDVFLCASLAGPRGFVLGLDTETESLAIARRNVEGTMERFGHTEPNVAFRKGSIERLRDAEVADEDFEVVISNRAFSLVHDKPAALREVFRVLKTGGEFHFSDIFADRRMSGSTNLCGAGVGAEVVYEGDFVRMAARAGFHDPRVVARNRLEVGDPGYGRCYAVTFRLFKLPELETPDEDYGQAAVYKGTVDGCPFHFALDEKNLFETGRARRVGGNTAMLLEKSRFAPHFEIIGNRERHFGPFIPSKV